MYMRLFAACWLLLCIGFSILAWGFKAPFAYDPVGPRAYPLLLLALMAVGSLWLLVKPAGSAEPIISGPLLRKVLLCILVLFIYALSFEFLGFILSTALAGFLLGMLYSGRPLPSACSGVLMGLLLYGLFDSLLDVPLPSGLLDIFLGN